MTVEMVEKVACTVKRRQTERVATAVNSDVVMTNRVLAADADKNSSHRHANITIYMLLLAAKPKHRLSHDVFTRNMFLALVLPNLNRSG